MGTLSKNATLKYKFVYFLILVVAYHLSFWYFSKVNDSIKSLRFVSSFDHLNKNTKLDGDKPEEMIPRSEILSNPPSPQKNSSG